MDTIVIRNYALQDIMKVLEYPMPFQKSRVKNRFMQVLSEKSSTLEKNRIEILNGLCEKDKDGKALTEIVKDKDGNDVSGFKISDENKIKWNEEYQKLVIEKNIIDITPSLKADLSVIKEIINNSPVDLTKEESLVVEEFITSLNKEKEKTLPAKKTKK